MVVRPPRGLKEIFVSRLIHSIVIGVLRGLSAEKVRYMIENDVDPFGKFAGVVDGGTLKKLIGFAKDHRDRIDEYLSYENVLVQADEHWEDVSPLFREPAGKAWAEKNLLRLKQMILQDLN